MAAAADSNTPAGGQPGARRPRRPAPDRLVGGLLACARTAATNDGSATLAEALSHVEEGDFPAERDREIVAGLKRLQRNGLLASRAGRDGSWDTLSQELGIGEAALQRLAGRGVPLDRLVAEARAFGQAATRRRKPARPAGASAGDDSWRDGPYFMDPTRGTFRGERGDGARLLANFTAGIIRKTSDDDGDPDAERTSGEELSGTRYTLEIRQGARKAELEVTAAEFLGMKWPARVREMDLWVEAGTTVTSQLRAAIERISAHQAEKSDAPGGLIPRSIRYVHTGWARIDDKWAYLHGAGGIDSDGSCDGIDVRLSRDLRACRLPPPPEGDSLGAAVRGSLQLLHLGPPRLMVPVLGAVYRAPLGPADFTVHIYGASGRFKTEIAKIALAHFHQCENSRELRPISWHSTDNAIEALLHQAKDSLLVLDDLLPAGLDDIERRRQLNTAARVFRAQGNQGGRSRLRSDTSERPAKAPRGLTLSTGEELPKGLSGVARAWLVEQREADVGSQELTAAQGTAPSYSAAMAAFLKWLAPQMDGMAARLRHELQEIRTAYPASHGRTSEIAANLELGWTFFLEFAEGCGAVTADRSREIRQTVRAALLEGSRDQMEEQAEADPVELFCDALSSALSSGRCYVEGPDGKPPAEPGSWGYTPRPGFDPVEWAPANRQGRVGWLLPEGLYLEPAAAYKAANTQLDSGLGIGRPALTKRLRDRGLLKSVGGSRHIPVIPPRSVGSHRPRCLHLDPMFLVAPVAPVAPGSAEREESRSDGSQDGLFAGATSISEVAPSGSRAAAGPGATGATRGATSPAEADTETSAATRSDGGHKPAGGATGATGATTYRRVKTFSEPQNGRRDLGLEPPKSPGEIEYLPPEAFEDPDQMADQQHADDRWEPEGAWPPALEEGPE